MVLSLYFTKCTSLSIIRGPTVKISNKTNKGSIIAKIWVVNQGEPLNQDSNHHCKKSNSFFCFINPSLTLAKLPLTVPEWLV